MYAKKLRETLGSLSVQMHSILDKASTENNRSLTSEERESWNKLLADYDGIESDIAIAEKTEKISADLRTTPKDEIMDRFNTGSSDAKARKGEATPHDKAFSAYLRHGVSGMSQEQARLMQAGPAEILNTAQTSTTTAGGYLIPSGFSDQLERAMKWFGGIEGFVGKIKTATGNPLPWPTVNDTANMGRIIGQNVQVTNTAVTFGQVNFGSFIGSSDLVLVPLSLAQDSYFDLDSLVASLLGERLGRLYNNKCTVGAGTTEPTGIVTAAVTSNLTLTFASTTVLTYAELVSLEHKVDAAYRDNPSAAWMFPDKVLQNLKTLVDGSSRPLWQPGLTSSFQSGASVTGFKPTILGHPYIVNADMVTPGAATDSVLFGDLSKFKVRDIEGDTLLVLRERYADYLQVGYIAFKRFDSNLVDAGTSPIAVGVQHA